MPYTSQLHNCRPWLRIYGSRGSSRAVLPKGYGQVFVRLTAFFVLGSLAVGINVPYTDSQLADTFSRGLPGAAASPYVVAMNRLKIQVLSDILNAMLLTAAFSAGNSYVYCASRSLYGLALEGKAPRLLTRCSRTGVPTYCVINTLLISLLSFLQVSNNANVVLQWLVNLVGWLSKPLYLLYILSIQVTASQLINFSVMAYTFICFMRACNAQGISRDSLPHKGWLQPYAAWYALIGCLIMTFVGGYAVFLHGNWDVPTFLFSYTVIGVFPILFIGWKVFKKTKWLRAEEADLKKDVKEIEDYSRDFIGKPPG